jgi:peptide/nickel transport system substrate-binding protein
VALQLNQATKNDKLREFFNTRDVRIAFSYAIDRDLLNELIYNGLATPRQYSPLSVSPQYYAKLSDAYLKYDPDTANKMLEDAGFKKGGDGFRTYKDGSPLTFQIEGTDAAGTPGEDAVQQVVKMLQAVGINCAYKYSERSLYTTHFEANEIEAAFWGGDRTVLPLAPGAPIFIGTMIDRPWAAGYGTWRNLGPDDPAAVEPPKDHFIWKLWDLWDQISAEADPAKQNALFFQILDIWAEELPMIGILGETPAFVIVKNGFKNFPEGFPMDDTTGDEHLYNTETYFWDDPSKHMPA